MFLARTKSKYFTRKAGREDNKVQKCATIDTLDHDMAHLRRPRCKYMGEMIQMDASQFYWIKDEQWYLHLAMMQQALL